MTGPATTGALADLERARCRARDAIYDWARPQSEFNALPFGRIKAACPVELREAHDNALTAIAEYEKQN